LLSNTRLACFSGGGSRKADFVTRRSLRRGTQQSSTTLETRACGAVRRSGLSSGSRSESAKDLTSYGDVLAASAGAVSTTLSAMVPCASAGP
jgi:hypothetical protein